MNIGTESWATNQTASNWNYFYHEFSTYEYEITSTTVQDTDADPTTTVTAETNETSYSDTSIGLTQSKVVGVPDPIGKNISPNRAWRLWFSYETLDDGHYAYSVTSLSNGAISTYEVDGVSDSISRNRQINAYWTVNQLYSTSDTIAVTSAEDDGTARLGYQISEATSYTPVGETYKDGKSIKCRNVLSEVSYERPKSKTNNTTKSLWSFEDSEDTITRRLAQSFSSKLIANPLGGYFLYTFYPESPIPSGTVDYRVEEQDPKQYKINNSVATVEADETLFVMTENSQPLKTLIGQNQNWAAYTEGEYSFTKTDDFTKSYSFQKYYTYEELSRGISNSYCWRAIFFGDAPQFPSVCEVAGDGYPPYTPEETEDFTYSFGGFGEGEELESETTLTTWTVEDFTKTVKTEETYSQKNESTTTTSWNYLPVETTSTFSVINTGTTEQLISSFETYDNGVETITTQVGYISLECETTFLDWSSITFETLISHQTERIHPLFLGGWVHSSTKQDFGDAYYERYGGTSGLVSISGSIYFVSSVYYNEAYTTYSLCDAAIKVYTPQHGSGFYAFGDDKSVTTNEMYVGIRATHKVGSLTNFDSVDSSVWASLLREQFGEGGGFVVMTDSCYLPKPNTSMTLSWSTIEDGPASSLGSTLVARLSSEYDGEVKAAEDTYNLELVVPCTNSTAHINGNIEALYATTFLAETVQTDEGVEQGFPALQGYPYALSAYIIARNDKFTGRDRTVVYDRGIYTVEKSSGGLEKGIETITVEEDYSSTFSMGNEEEWAITKENVVFVSTYAGGTELFTKSRGDDYILKYYSEEEEPDFSFADDDTDE